MLVLGAFTCNVCGAENLSGVSLDDREAVSCGSCRSTLRLRGVMLALSRALFGMDLALPDFPRLRSVRGLGISDSEVYSHRLATKFTYANTFYHRAPMFDLVHPDEKEFGRYDFVICSEVLEHVPAPVDVAFQTLAKLLKPSGALILTVPFRVQRRTVEHFPHATDSGMAEVGGKPVLVQRSADGTYGVFDELVFHGGHGSTLEMRVFSETGLRSCLSSAGFDWVRFETSGNRGFGVHFTEPSSLPIIAGKQDLSVHRETVRELVEELTAARMLLRAVRESRWVRYGRAFGVGPKLPADRSDLGD